MHEEVEQDIDDTPLIDAFNAAILKILKTNELPSEDKWKPS
jgi:hypothetical protein